MILVILGILALIISIIFGCKNNNFMTVICILIGVFLCFAGIFFPVSGYEEMVILEEHKLEKITSEGNIYVVQIDDNTAKYMIKDQNGNEILCTNPNVSVVILKNPKVPVVRKYLIKAKKSKYTFAMIPERIEYKIFVNEYNVG